jgi:hypothetical protein
MLILASPRGDRIRHDTRLSRVAFGAARYPRSRANGAAARHSSAKIVVTIQPTQSGIWWHALSGKFDDPEYWLTVANESRATAQFMGDSYSKRTMRLIAQRYEIMAERAKRRSEEQAALKSA